VTRTGFALRGSTRSARAAQAIRSGDIDFAIAGGVESMTPRPSGPGAGRAKAFFTRREIYDTTIGWRFITR